MARTRGCESVNLWRVLSEPFGAVLINGDQSSFPVFFDNVTFKTFSPAPTAPKKSGQSLP
jgi:hypothetical protein